jgi:hypothetical protein
MIPDDKIALTQFDARLLTVFLELNWREFLEFTKHDMDLAENIRAALLEMGFEHG